MADKEVMVDTSILIEYFRKKRKGNTRLYKLVEEGFNIVVSSITEFEILNGAKSDHREFWSQMRTFIEVLPFDSEAARVSADVVASLKKSRKSIDKPDLFIAATALVYQLQFDTLNRKHFKDISGLKLMSE